MNRTEAIKILRETHDKALFSVRTALETLIPELEESEDERNWKAVLDCVKDDALKEWLEKQKEQTSDIILKAFENSRTDYSLEERKEASDYSEKVLPTSIAYGESEEEYWMHKVIEAAYIAGQKEQKPLSTEETELNSLAFLEQMGYTCIPPGKEQKPVEWSENYREEDLRTRFAFYTYKDEDDVLYLSNVFVEETSRNKGFGTKILAAAEKVAETLGVIIIRLKVKQNSPANAWYRKHGYGFMAFEGDYDWLEKTLEYMKPVKQEWSEEDKGLLERAISIVGWAGSCTDKYKIINPDGAAELQKFLKSLRSSWKPSEEQMEALMLAIEGKCAPTSYMSRRLEDLYEALVNEFHVECKLDK